LWRSGRPPSSLGSASLRIDQDLERELDFFRRDEDFFLGTLAPFFRASDSPIAMACLRLFTLPP
jgi:hypothetical protein